MQFYIVYIYIYIYKKKTFGLDLNLKTAYIFFFFCHNFSPRTESSEYMWNDQMWPVMLLLVVLS